MTIKETVDKKLPGLFYGNRVILPFQAYFLKIVIDDDIYTDFSGLSKETVISEEGNFTNIYFREYDSITDAVSKYESIKIIAVEKGEDIFNPANHLKITLSPEGGHYIKIEFTDQDTLLIE